MRATRLLPRSLYFCAALAGAALPAQAAAPDIPVLVPITGFLAAEGGSQRNGALLALRNPPVGVQPNFAVTDTGTSPEGAVNALERALSDENPRPWSPPCSAPRCSPCCRSRWSSRCR